MDIPPSSYPCRQVTARGEVASEATTVQAFGFGDKVLVTISQRGQLAQWMQVPTSTNVPMEAHQMIEGNEDELSGPRLTATTLFGGGDSDRETIGQLYASHVATLWADRHPGDPRTVLVGLGLVKTEPTRQQFLDLMELVVQVF